MEFTFKDFKKRALDTSLSNIEKVGFPDSYRKDSEALILEDISTKLLLDQESISVLDVGCGCSGLTELMIEKAKKNSFELTLVDSEEMLSNLKNVNDKNIKLVPGYFPEIESIKNSKGSFDAILVYSVLQYVFLEQNIYTFIHRCIDLLKTDGRLLLGDIPNFEARKRFLESGDGHKFISNQNKESSTGVDIQHENEERIDDAVIMSILTRFRKFGCETYLMPQNKNLPFGNRREDILIVKR